MLGPQAPSLEKRGFAAKEQLPAMSNHICILLGCVLGQLSRQQSTKARNVRFLCQALPALSCQRVTLDSGTVPTDNCSPVARHKKLLWGTPRGVRPGSEITISLEQGDEGSLETGGMRARSAGQGLLVTGHGLLCVCILQSSAESCAGGAGGNHGSFGSDVLSRELALRLPSDSGEEYPIPAPRS